MLEWAIHKVIGIQSIPVNAIIKVHDSKSFLIRWYCRTPSVHCFEECEQEAEIFGFTFYTIVVRYTNWSQMSLNSMHSPIVREICHRWVVDYKGLTSYHGPGMSLAEHHCCPPRSEGNVPWVLAALLLVLGTQAVPGGGQLFLKWLFVIQISQKIY